MPFSDRHDAGRRLAARLERYRGRDAIVLAMPRGGVPVAFEVACALQLPLDVLLVRKLGVPFQPELAMGAIGENGVRVTNERVMRECGVREPEVAAVEARERIELGRRVARYRGGRPLPSLDGRIALVVDDGIATGSTARAACRVARTLGAAEVVLAAPVAPAGAARTFARDADEVELLETPAGFWAIGQFYEDFAQTTDEEVVDLLARASRSTPAGSAPTADPQLDFEVVIPSAEARLSGRLTIPPGARGLVIFAHGSGSSRHSPRNRFVASVLQRARLGTLLFDLLTPVEERNRANVFDIDLLAKRLVDATNWVRTVPGIDDLPLAYFGASTGAAAALRAAAEPEAPVVAVVSRGGRPDLAAPWLGAVRAPTLLIVGERDEPVLEMNRAAQAALRCTSALAVVPGATHLFEEPGTLARAARLACDWFHRHLPLAAASAHRPARVAS